MLPKVRAIKDALGIQIADGQIAAIVAEANAIVGLHHTGRPLPVQVDALLEVLGIGDGGNPGSG